MRGGGGQDFALMVHFSESRGKFDKEGLSSIHSKHEKKQEISEVVHQRSDYSLICNVN